MKALPLHDFQFGRGSFLGFLLLSGLLGYGAGRHISSPTSPLALPLQSPPSMEHTGTRQKSPSSEQPSSVPAPQLLSAAQVLQKIQEISSDSSLSNLTRSFLVREVIASADPSTFPDILTGFLALPRAQGGEYAALLFQRWSRINKNDAVQNALNIPNPEQRRGMCMLIATSIAKGDSGETLLWSRQLTDPRQQPFLEALMTEMAKVNFKGVWNEAQNRPDLLKCAEIWSGLIMGAPESDRPNIASAAWQRFGGDVISLAGVLERWAQVNPTEANQWFSRLPSSPHNDFIYQSLVFSWMDQDPAGFAEYFKNLPPEKQAPQAADAWIRRDPAAARIWIDSLPNGSQKRNALESYFKTLAVSDPILAAEELLRLKPPQGRAAFVHEVCFQWAHQNSPEMKRWIDQIDDPSIKAAAAATAAFYDRGNNPQQTAEWLLKTTGDERFPAFEATFLNWKNLDEAFLWASRLKDKDVAVRFGVEMILRLGASNPDDAVRFANEKLPPERVNFIHRAIASRMVQEDPITATQWVVRLPEGEPKAKAWEGLMSHWIDFSPMSASRWLDQQASGPPKDAAIGILVNHVLERDPEGAACWSSSISDPTLRLNQVEKAVRQWMKTNPSAATAWIKQSSLPEDFKKRF